MAWRACVYSSEAGLLSSTTVDGVDDLGVKGVQIWHGIRWIVVHLYCFASILLCSTQGYNASNTQASRTKRGIIGIKQARKVHKANAEVSISIHPLQSVQLTKLNPMIMEIQNMTLFRRLSRD